MAAIFDRYLLLLGTCHGCSLLTVRKCEISQRSCHCLFTYQFKTCSLHSYDSFILDKQTSDLCVDSSYHLVCQLVRIAKHKSHGNVITLTRQTFSKCAWIEVFAHEMSCGSSMTVTQLAPCALHTYMKMCVKYTGHGNAASYIKCVIILMCFFKSYKRWEWYMFMDCEYSYFE